MQHSQFDALNRLSDDQLRSLNSTIVEIIRSRNAVKARITLQDFRPGQNARVCSEKHGDFMIRIDRINQKTVTGRELVNGVPTHKVWRVHPSFLKAA